MDEAKTTGSPSRPSVRSRQIGVRVTEDEYQSLERTAWQSGRKVADWVREQVVDRIDLAEEDRLISHVFTELIGLQMLLMGCFAPLLQGQRLAPEQYQDLVRSVQAGKGKRARELLAQRLGREGK